MLYNTAMITQETVKSLLHYCPESGVLTRNSKVAGGLSSDGYTTVGINTKRYYAHRIAWLYVHGKFPVADLDHINGDRRDNRMINLREATRTQNNANRKYHKLKGVTKQGRHNSWMARLEHNRKRYYFGSFSTPEEAHVAYLKGAEEIFGEYSSHLSQVS